MSEVGGQDAGEVHFRTWSTDRLLAVPLRLTVYNNALPLLSIKTVKQLYT